MGAILGILLVILLFRWAFKGVDFIIGLVLDALELITYPLRRVLKKK